MVLPLLVMAARAEAQVKVWVVAPPNLADAREPMPELRIRNDTPDSIEIQVFVGVPFTFLERADDVGGFSRDAVGGCGNGYEPRRLGPGRGGHFPLWSLIEHGPGIAGRYRVVLPYARIDRARHWRNLEATSPPFDLAYGATRPRRWHADSPRPAVEFVRAEAERVREGVDPSPDATDLGRRLLPTVAACVEPALQRIPWLRGRFQVAVYRYPRQPAPVTFLGMSLLGDEAVNRCLDTLALRDDGEINGSYVLDFAVGRTGASTEL